MSKTKYMRITAENEKSIDHYSINTTDGEFTLLQLIINLLRRHDYLDLKITKHDNKVYLVEEKKHKLNVNFLKEDN